MVKRKKRKPSTTAWIDNLILLEKTGDPGRCPFCNSENIDVERMNFGRESINLLCRDCGKLTHLDGTLDGKTGDGSPV